jgi:hypothetical protein
VVERVGLFDPPLLPLFQKAKEAAKRAKAMAMAANALGCTPDEVEALVLINKLRGDN